MSIIIAAAALGGLGIVFSVILAFAHKKFAVEVDPKVERIQALLPSGNCGACGFAGCLGFAEAVAQGHASADGCLAGGPSVAKAVGEVMGVAVEEKEELIAFVHCQAGRSMAPSRYEYRGVQSCHAASLLFGGDKLCVYGCLGLGDCERACPFDAIHVNEDGLAVVDRDKCTACTKCVAACPRGIIEMVPKAKTVHVACKNLDKGKDAKKVCSVSCIACRLCEKNCPVNAIPVVNNLAVLDYSKCNECGICVEKCPQKTIIKLGAPVEVSREPKAPEKPEAAAVQA